MSGLVELLAWLQGPGLGLLASGLLCLMRVGGAMALLPALGEQVVPPRIRLGITLALTAAVAPAIGPGVAITPAALMAEAAVGLMIGLGFRLFVMTLQMAGTFAAQTMSLAQMFTTAGPEPQPAIASLLTMAGLALFCTLGLHVDGVELLIRSYRVLPPGQLPLAADAAAWGSAQIGRSFALAFTLAAPFVIGGLIYNLALGAINRAMPTLMVVMVGAPALTAGGLLLLIAVAPLALTVWLDALQDWIAAPFALPR